MKKDKSKRTKRLTVKQDKFVKEYAENGGNGVKAALQTYDTSDYNTANQIAVENLQKPTVQTELARLMKESDVTPKRTLRVVSDGMSATKGNGEPDHPTRLRAADMSFKLHGAYPSNQQSSIHQHAHLHLVEALDDLSAEEIDEELAKLEE